MSLSSFFVHTITVSRRLATTGFKSSYQTVGTFSCNIQPVTAEYAAVNGMVFGRTYNAYLSDAADIQIDDKLIDQDGKEYRVTGTQKRNYGYSQPHLTLMLSEEPTSGEDR